MRRWFILFAIALGSTLRAADERAPLDRARVLEALEHGLGTIQAEIELVDYSSFPAPPGEIVFEWNGLTPANSPRAATRWTGYVRRADGDRFSIWAIVRLQADISHVIATEAISAGQVIRAEQIHEESYHGFPSKETALRADQVIGKAAIRPMRVGTVVRLENLSAPAAIRKGSTATADYRSGSVHLRLPVVAEQDGRIGDRIRVRSMSTQRMLSGLVLADGTLAISGTADGDRGNERNSSK